LDITYAVRTNKNPPYSFKAYCRMPLTYDVRYYRLEVNKVKDVGHKSMKQHRFAVTVIKVWGA
jgi:hypothetical protein